MEEHDDTDTDARDSSLGDSMLFFEYDDDNDNEEENDENDIYARPIVVGYAFGVKKMSTMSVVMAEASKAKLSAVPESATVECCLAEDNTTNAVTSGGGGGDAICHDVVCRGEEEPTVLLAHTTTTTTKILSTHNPRHYKAAAAACIEPELEQAETMNGNHKRAEQEDAVVATNNFVFTIATEKIQGGGGSCSDLRNIVQHFRSSFCSSVGGGESAGGGSTGNTACSTFSVTSLPRTYSVSGSTSVASSLRKNPSANTPTPPRDESKVIPVRVSFVPLDLGKHFCERVGWTGSDIRDQFLSHRRFHSFFLFLFDRHSARRTTRWEDGCHFTQADRGYSVPFANGYRTATNESFAIVQ